MFCPILLPLCPKATKKLISSRQSWQLSNLPHRRRSTEIAWFFNTVSPNIYPSSTHPFSTIPLAYRPHIQPELKQSQSRKSSVLRLSERGSAMLVFVLLNHISEGIKKGIQSTIQSQRSGPLLSRILEIFLFTVTTHRMALGRTGFWAFFIWVGLWIGREKDGWKERKASSILKEKIWCAMRWSVVPIGVVVYVGLNIKISSFCLRWFLVWGWFGDGDRLFYLQIDRSQGSFWRQLMLFEESLSSKARTYLALI